jgi:hypothetical protein
MEWMDDVHHVESRFGLFGDGLSVGARQVHGYRNTIGSEIILNELDGTPS